MTLSYHDMRTQPNGKEDGGLPVVEAFTEEKREGKIHWMPRKHVLYISLFYHKAENMGPNSPADGFFHA